VRQPPADDKPRRDGKRGMEERDPHEEAEHPDSVKEQDSQPKKQAEAVGLVE
jgi:hypothetical protein